MSRRPALVTQADVARALRAVEQVRYPGVVEITANGTIRIVPLNAVEKATVAESEPIDEAPIEDF